MFDLPTLLPFFVALFALQAAPGPDMLLVIGRGIGQGRRVALLTAAGATLLSGVVQLPLLALGLASLIQSSPLAFNVLCWAGAAYLVWLGAKVLFRAGLGLTEIAAPAPVSDRTALRDGMISNLLNPKVLVFMLAFLPQFVDPNGAWSVTAQLIVLGTMQKLSGFVVLASVAMGAGGLGDSLSQRPKLIAWQNRFTGVVLVALVSGWLLEAM